MIVSAGAMKAGVNMRKRVVLTVLMALVATVVSSQVREVIGFRVPELDEENRLKSQVSGDKARFEGDGAVHISGLKIETFEDGRIDMTISSPECTYDRNTRIAQSKSRVRIDRENMVITGEDYVYDSGKRTFEIKKDVKVVLIDAGGREPIAGGKEEQ